MAEHAPRRILVEWQTLLLIILCYGLWLLGCTVVASLSLWLSYATLTFALALHSSLQHEVLHGHPLRSRALSEALVFPAIGLFIPYMRFRDLHLAHHQDSILTDPYDDPESNYMDPKVWNYLPRWQQVVLNLNNTLLGRMLIGPIIAQIYFVKGDWRLIRAGDRTALMGWVWHFVGLVPVLFWLFYVAEVPFWLYVLAAYSGLAILKIRTFLEHRAHEHVGGRTVIIEDKGPLALIFLNNNLHVVHHMHPAVPWYKLPQLYAQNKDRYLKRNENYLYRSYGEVFRKHFFRRKDDVPHPFWRR
ncbi:fatty acid desaturase [Pseudohalocynthiibacter aestuariivivens]|jgi:fatty acid desaturase|uniref:Fatty acid desaturase n=1 Tax=Pseudohalocynthiibacter aestuariivivens TaxID=1591409 RepID=A0ABV5JEM2_9RHOB|nr:MULTISPECIES: fatty acid desaturase [Pseudohalocynthiibacter]MBS9716993.1 fatty acid desaturase [Pseudohalocynthiibacter aestuariivivens]MCK0101908.1 fatty acid desaturase [Pseudohalocynthiibacter sp. F2068]